MPSSKNPLLAPWSGEFETPPFGEIAAEHFSPAFGHALAGHRREIEAIAADPSDPTFDDTVAALERSGKPLARVTSLFHLLAGADTNDAIMAIEREITPRLATHWNDLYMNAAVFRRVDALHQQRERLDLTSEQLRVLERYHLDFRRAGVDLAADAKRRLAEITEQLAAL